MQALTGRRLAGLWLGCVVVASVSVVLGLVVGSTSIGWPGAWIFEYRFGRSCAAGLVGAALATAGVGYQTVLRNPLAEPYLLGVSGGAALAVFAWSLPDIAGAAWLTALGREAAGLVGGLAAVAIVLTLAGGRGRLEPQRAILIGVVVGVLFGGLFALLVQLTREPAGGAMSFLFGRIESPGTVGLIRIACTIAGESEFLAWMMGRASLLAAGEEEARAAGLR